MRRHPSLSSLLIIATLAGGCAYKPQPRAAGWLQLDTQHLRLRTNISRGRATRLAADLQRTRDLLARHALGCAFEGEVDPIPVTLLKSSEFRDLVPVNVGAYYLRSDNDWLGEFAGQLVLPDNLGRDAIQVFQHELTHHLVRSCFPAAPSWLDEGLAKFLETVVVEDGKMTLGLPPFAIKRRLAPGTGHSRGVRVDMLPLDMLPPLESILAMPYEAFVHQRSALGLEVAANYAVSWALVHFLEIGADDLKPRFESYLGGLRQIGADPQKVFADAFEGVGLQARLTDYLWRGRYPLFAAAVGPAQNTVVRVRPMSAGEGHLQWAWLWRVQKDGGRERSRLHLAAAKADATARARAHLLSAAILVDARDLATAEREVSEGLRGDAGDPALLDAQVRLLLARKASPADLEGPLLKLRGKAKTAEQLCAAGQATLALGDAKTALALTSRALQMRPHSWPCHNMRVRVRRALPQ